MPDLRYDGVTSSFVIGYRGPVDESTPGAPEELSRTGNLNVHSCIREQVTAGRTSEGCRSAFSMFSLSTTVCHTGCQRVSMTSR